MQVPLFASERNSEKTVSNLTLQYILSLSSISGRDQSIININMNEVPSLYSTYTTYLMSSRAVPMRAEVTT